jgi:hypothetical protein
MQTFMYASTSGGEFHKQDQMESVRLAGSGGGTAGHRDLRLKSQFPIGITATATSADQQAVKSRHEAVFP